MYEDISDAARFGLIIITLLAILVLGLGTYSMAKNMLKDASDELDVMIEQLEETQTTTKAEQTTKTEQTVEKAEQIEYKEDTVESLNIVLRVLRTTFIVCLAVVIVTFTGTIIKDKVDEFLIMRRYERQRKEEERQAEEQALDAYLAGYKTFKEKELADLLKKYGCDGEEYSYEKDTADN